MDETPARTTETRAPGGPAARLGRWVRGVGTRAGVAFAVVGTTLIAVQIVALLIVGGAPQRALLPVMVFNGLYAAYLPALILLLDRQAVAALDRMRPALELADGDYRRTRFRLANMPAGAALLAGLTSTALVLLMELGIAPARYAGLPDATLFLVVFQLVDKLSAFFFGVFIYHTLRQLRLINAVTGRHLRLPQPDLGLLQAFSRVTAATAIGLVVGVYAWLLINPDLLRDPLIIGFAVVVTLLATAVFVWPLTGIHRHMQLDRDRRLLAIERDFEAVAARFNTALHADDFPAVERLNAALAGLEIQRNRAQAMPTWPWRSETVQFALTAITLPLILTVAQFLVEQAIN